MRPISPGQTSVHYAIRLAATWLGLAFSRSWAAQDVRLCWTRNGRPQTPIQGRPVAQGNDADRWLCELGVLDAGDVAAYWMVVTGDDQQAETPRYHFSVRRQRRLARITAVAPHGQGRALATCADDSNTGPTITVALI